MQYKEVPFGVGYLTLALKILEALNRLSIVFFQSSIVISNEPFYTVYITRQTDMTTNGGIRVHWIRRKNLRVTYCHSIDVYHLFLMPPPP